MLKFLDIHQAKTKIMLIILRFPIAISAAIISSLSLFPTIGIAQDYPICFMITSSGQVVNLTNLCQIQEQDQALQKAKVCQGPFDKDGFPIVLSGELNRLKAAVERARKRNVESSDDLEVQSALTALLNQTPLSERTRGLLQERKRLYKKLLKMEKPEEVARLSQEMRAVTEELNNDMCLGDLEVSMAKKFRKDLLF